MSADDPASRFLVEGIEKHRRGDLAGAIRLFQKAVRKAPKHADSLNLLGLAHFQSGELEQAAVLLEQALMLKPQLSSGDYNLGTVLQRLGRHEAALPHYRRAIELGPEDADAHNNLGTTLKALGRPEEAIESLRRAVALRRNWGEAHFNLANALQATGKNQEALDHYEQSVRYLPNPANAHLNLGNVLQALNRHGDAARQYELAVARMPSNAEAHFNLGSVLHELDRPADAVESFRNALKHKPHFVEALVNMGAALLALGEVDEARVCFERALALRPGQILAHCGLAKVFGLSDRYADAAKQYNLAAAAVPNSAAEHYNIGTALRALGRHQDAMHAFERAIEIDPTHEEALSQLAVLPLSLGDFPTGWSNMERYRGVRFRGYRPELSQPRWNGSNVQGTLLVWGDQGLGDQILYASMVAELRDRADRIVLEVEPRLVPLFARSFPTAEVIDHSALAGVGRIDAQEPFASLGRVLRNDWASFPTRDRGYLVADGERTIRLRRQLKSDGRVLVGLSWRSTSPRAGFEKSINLRDFEPLLRMPGVRIVDLQYGETRAERETVERELGVELLRLEEIDNTNDIDGLASLIDACDTVVSVSNTNAHLAGALGKPTVLLLRPRHARLWYWFDDRENSPWYPRAMIFTQLPGQPWTDLVGSALPVLETFGAGRGD